MCWDEVKGAMMHFVMHDDACDLRLANYDRVWIVVPLPENIICVGLDE